MRNSASSLRRAQRGSSGFAIAPILYLLGLVGVGAGVLFSGYSQILRSNQSMSNTLAAKNDLQGIATTLAATSWLSNDRTLLCPPLVGSNSPSTPSANCSTSVAAISVGSSFASGTPANRPANDTTIVSTGSPVEGGIFRAGSGVKVLDPWGHYYLYCRWENTIGSSPAIMIISAGANGKTETKCGDTVAGGDDLIVEWTTAVTQNRAAVWQTTTSGTAVTGAQFGQTGSQVSIDTTGDVSIPGTLGVTGATTLGTANIGTMSVSNITDTGTLAVVGTSSMAGLLSGTAASFSSTLGVTGLSTLGQVSAGTTTMTYATVTNNASIGGTLGVTGATTLGTTTIDNISVTNASYFGGNVTTSSSKIQIGTSVVATGSSSPLLTVGKGIGSPAVYPFTVDQAGNVTGGTFTGSFSGNLTGSQSGGTIAATGFSTSGSFSSTGTGTATFAGPVQATQFVGAMTIGSGGVSMSGVLPLANGGTGYAASSTSNLLSYLATGATGTIPGADLVSGSVTSTQLNSIVAAGTYSTVTVDASCRVTSGTMSGGTVSSISDGSGDMVGVGTSSGITFTIGSSTVGNWKSTGLMVGTSTSATNKLDVSGAQAIGSSYAGSATAPANGLIVQGNVGIGTNNPGTNALQVNGTVSATNFVGNGSGLTGIASLSGGTANYVPLWTGATTLGTANIYQSGSNIGIGTTSPGDSLEVNGNVYAKAINAVGDLARYNATGGVYLAGHAGSNWASIKAYSDSSGTAKNLAINETGGNVGIGTTAPANILHVYSGNVEFQHDYSATVPAQFGIFGQTNPNRQLLIGYNTGSDYGSIQAIKQGTANEPLVLQPNGGNVGIGTTSPRSKLDVYGAEVQVGSSGNTCSSTYAGAIRFNGSTLYYCDGTSTWQSVLATGGGGGGVTGTGTSNYVARWTSATSIGTGTLYDNGTQVGIGTTSLGTNFTLNGTQAYQFATNYTTTGTQNDVPIGTTGASVRYAGVGTATFNGISGGVNGQVLYLHNGSNSTLTLANQNASDTTVANQIVTGTGTSLSVASNSAVILQYDATATNSSGATGAWRVIGGSGGSAIPAGTTGQVQYNSGSNQLAASSNFTWLSANNALIVGTGAATPSASTGTVATPTVNVISNGTSFSVLAGAAGSVTVNPASTGQMAYYSGSGTLSGTSDLYVSGANIALGTSTGSYLLSLDGQAARTIGMQRDYTAATAGQSLTLSAGGAVSGGSNLNGGNLVLSSGVSTGTGTSSIQFQTSPGTAGSTTDNTIATAMTITGGGNVGIGTTSPSGLLYISGTGGGSGNIGVTVQNTTATTGKTWRFTNVDSDGTLRLTQPGVVDAITILPTSGYVGIGITNPVSTLNIADISTISAYYGTYNVNAYYNGGWKYQGNGLAWGIGNNYSGVTNGVTIATAATNSSGAGAALTWTPTFNISTSGNVGIGSTNPQATLDVNGGIKVGNTTTCGSGQAGTLRYSGGSPPWQYCDGSTWQNFKQPRCQNDGTGECYLDATRSVSDPDFVATNIKNGVNILGVTGSYVGTTTTFHVTTSQNNINLFTIAGSPTSAGSYTIYIDAGVTIGSYLSTVASVTTGTFPASSTVTLINNGNIYGRGGDGGMGGTQSGSFDQYKSAGNNGTAGSSGGNAISLSYNLTIDNTNGYIFGGGGGGGGGGFFGYNSVNGGGGGGGQGAANSNGGIGYTYGSAGSTGGAGGGGAGGSNAGNGGAGGAWGAAGSSGTASASPYSGSAGGSGGNAVKLNGYTVTWTGGNNGTQVKGLVN